MGKRGEEGGMGIYIYIKNNKNNNNNNYESFVNRLTYGGKPVKNATQ